MIYRPEIDGLRAIAVLPVILFHAGFDFFAGGFVGVDVFFVISGYLITSVILSELSVGKFTLAGFYERRVRRILPALFFVVLVCLPFAWVFMLPSDMISFSRSVVAVLTFSSNVLFWTESGYFDTAAELKPLLHTWSLAAEEQYYIIFPIFLLLIWRLGERFVLGLLIAIFLLSLGLAQWAAYNYPVASFYLLPTRGWELLLGVFAALYSLRIKQIQKNQMAGQSLGILGLTLILYAMFTFDRTTPFPGILALVPTLGTVLIILFSVEGTLVNSMLRTKWLVGIGLMSYSAYLWHQPLFAFAKYRVLVDPPESLMAALCLLTFPLAYLSWRYVEKPFRRKHGYSRRFVYSSCVVCGAGLLVFGLIGHNQEGYASQRFTDAQLSLLSSAKLETLPSCEDISETCGNGTASNNDVLLLGDSNAFHFSQVLEDTASELGGRVLNMTRGGCLPLSPFDRKDTSSAFNKSCIQMNDRIRALIDSSKQLPKTAVISAAWALYYYGPEYYESVGGDRMPLSRAKLVYRDDETAKVLTRAQIILLFDEYLTELAEYLSTRFERVAFVAPLPPLANELRRHALLEESPASDLSDFERENRDLLSLFRRLDDMDGVRVFYPHEVLCGVDAGRKCVTFSDNKHLYSDSIHVSGYGQRLVFSNYFRSLVRSK